MILRIAKIIARKFNSWKRGGFDPSFYLDHYEDLKSIRTYEKARLHYIRHGKAEGRFANEDEYLKSAKNELECLKNDFDIVAYRYYNRDLVNHFKNDDELFKHYIRHGRNEGRLCRFPEGEIPTASLLNEDKWKSIFSFSDFLAWCGDELDYIPKSKNEALEIFCSQGIDKIWPISLEYAFDVKFCRENNLMSDYAAAPDQVLYRAWLVEGFPAGIAPNEQLFLASYLHGYPYPLSLNWRALSQRLRLSSTFSRSQTLIALFGQSSSKIISNIDLMGNDAAWLLEKIARHALVRGDFSKAIAVLERSVAISPTAERICILGDAYHGLGAEKHALEAYATSTNMDQAPIAAFLHSATIHAAHRNFEESFAMLRKAFPSWRQKDVLRDKLYEVVDLYFQYQSARAHAIYREAIERSFDPAVRASADSLLCCALDQIKHVLLEMDALPAPTGGNPAGYVAILANDDLRQCTYYRIEQKLLHFERAGIPVKIFPHSDVEGFVDSLIGARAAIFYRVAAVPAILRAILHANSMNLSTYYEIDDLIFDPVCYPDPFSSFEGQISISEYAGLQFGVPLFRYAISMCKGSIASTPALAEKMRVLATGDANFVICNSLDERSAKAASMGDKPLRQHNGAVRIFYGSGTKAHNSDFNRLVAPAILEMMKRYSQVELVIVGHLKLGPELQEMQQRIITYPFISDITAYWSLLASCDINLAVLETGTVADCKSEIKWLEAAILQLPSIVSGTRTYLEVISHGKDGFIANSQAEWCAILDQLICHPRLRSRVGAAARVKALRDYDPEVVARKLKSEFGASSPVDGDAPNTPPRRLRVLICNVFFAPQSYGGATRVVEDNVRDFASTYPDLEIGIFCSDEGSKQAGRLRLCSENGIPVYRLSTPQDVRIDWTPFNDDHAAPFERVLEHFRPNLIHFHCVQRLTATIVEVALQRKIPYVVTLHDAWWISDDQFLVGKDGLRLPNIDCMSDGMGALMPLASITRRQRLASLLQHAKANLAVSAPFAKIYENAGIRALRVIENGVPVLDERARLPHSRRVDGRVALGHLGGRSAHKGAGLIEVALRRGHYSNLHLTIVDGTLAPGQTIDTIWGTTPVTITAPYAQSQVAALYSQLDVLIAPSTWPESFGLVAREALEFGLWVVASDLGAIGQDVDEGRNGHLIDVSTKKGLSDILMKIDTNPEPYRISPSNHRLLRSMTDQAFDLHKLYHQINAEAKNNKIFF